MRLAALAVLVPLTAIADPAPPPPPPQNVAPQVLEASRIAGDRLIVPDDVTKTVIQRSGKTRIVGAFKLCVTTSGSIASANTLKSTGFTDYDTKILGKINAWKYKPFMVNGKAVPVCTAVTFIYSQTNYPTVSPAQLLGKRTAGADAFTPPDPIVQAMRAAKETSVSVTMNVCVEKAGKVTSALAVPPSKYPEYDAAVAAGITSTWTFKALPSDACARIPFVFKVPK